MCEITTLCRRLSLRSLLECRWSWLLHVVLHFTVIHSRRRHANPVLLWISPTTAWTAPQNPLLISTLLLDASQVTSLDVPWYPTSLSFLGGARFASSFGPGRYNVYTCVDFKGDGYDFEAPTEYGVWLGNTPVQNSTQVIQLYSGIYLTLLLGISKRMGCRLLVRNWCSTDFSALSESCPYDHPCTRWCFIHFLRSSLRQCRVRDPELRLRWNRHNSTRNMEWAPISNPSRYSGRGQRNYWTILLISECLECHNMPELHGPLALQDAHFSRWL